MKGKNTKRDSIALAFLVTVATISPNIVGGATTGKKEPDTTIDINPERISYKQFEMENMGLMEISEELAVDNLMVSISKSSNRGDRVKRVNKVSRGLNRTNEKFMALQKELATYDKEDLEFLKLNERDTEYLDGLLVSDKVNNSLELAEIKREEKVAEQNIADDLAVKYMEEQIEIARKNREKRLKELEKVKRENPKVIGEMSVPTDVDTSFKSYMDFRKITNRKSRQYQLQDDGNTYTNEEGFRMRDGKYMIAVGTFYSKECGPILKVTLTSGVAFLAIVGEIKDDRDTDPTRRHRNGNVIEFIVDTKKMDPKVVKSGNMSTAPKAGLIGGVAKMEIVESN